MVQIPAKPLSLEEFLAIPETKPASEYIDGTIIQKPMPQGKHSALQRELSFALTAVFRKSKVAQAFPELRCTFGGRSLVPDVAVFQTPRIPRDSNGNIANAFNLPPDWTIEILSPNQKQTKVIRNILYCLNHGTEMGWLVDPDEYCIFVYSAGQSVQIFECPSLENGEKLEDGEQECTEALLPVPEFAQAVQLTVGEIFGWLKE
jgi:Uma2 family endonuclease